MSTPPLADGPAMYFGSTIMTFALPYGAFIAAAIALFFLFRARHSGPKLRWSGGSVGQVASVTTWEPGPAPAPGVTTAAPASESAAPEEPAPEESAPEESAPEETEVEDKTQGQQE